MCVCVRVCGVCVFQVDGSVWATVSRHLIWFIYVYNWISRVEGKFGGRGSVIDPLSRNRETTLMQFIIQVLAGLVFIQGWIECVLCVCVWLLCVCCGVFVVMCVSHKCGVVCVCVCVCVSADGLSQCVCEGNLLLGSQVTEDTLGI